MFKELFTEKEEIINSGSQSKIDALMDKAQEWEENNKYACQNYYSFTKDYKTYYIKTDDIKDVKQHDVYKILKGK